MFNHKTWRESFLQIEILASCLTIKHDANLFIKLLRTYSYLFQIKVCAANVQERLVFKKYFFILIFAAINQERLLFESVHYWRGYGSFSSGSQKTNCFPWASWKTIILAIFCCSFLVFCLQFSEWAYITISYKTQ